MLLCYAFGLRIKEAMCFRPHRADRGDRVAVRWGTKNGRPREVLIISPFQRAVLELAKDYARSADASTIPAEPATLPLRRWYWRFVYVVRRYGQVSTRQLGVTMHGLRHQHLNELYEHFAALERPLRRAQALSAAQAERDRAARALVARQAGHARPAISTAYLGGRTPLSPKKPFQPTRR
jgi:integrase